MARKLADATGVPLDRAAASALAAKEDEEGFQLDRNNPELHLLRGKRLLVEGQTDSAVREMREAVKADPSRAQAYVDLARALMQKPEGTTAAQEALVTAIRTMIWSTKDLPVQDATGVNSVVFTGSAHAIEAELGFHIHLFGPVALRVFGTYQSTSFTFDEGQPEAAGSATDRYLGGRVMLRLQF